MKIKKFDDLMVWQKSVELTISIYASLELINDFGLKNQIQRASLSISNNIAEGFERGSDRDFKRFLYIAQGSCSEVKSMLYVATRLNYLKNESYITLNHQVTEIGKMLFGLSNSLSDGSTRNFRNPKLTD
ncbi:four helix bundle protein [Aquirufa regiilacus]|uniref:Four helix bundle protein n=1 Tax=Aquirufa regiilacus TaxID=3024868 RepID=A0ABU3TT48_9BACT|nr:four helix bundle protein [Aquirufa sp. LEOWEIH-7C]MDU0809041.1 four helix bundle protein [Aquirufa sp. LEOWEIH-7C]